MESYEGKEGKRRFGERGLVKRGEDAPDSDLLGHVMILDLCRPSDRNGRQLPSLEKKQEGTEKGSNVLGGCEEDPNRGMSHFSHHLTVAGQPP